MLSLYLLLSLSPLCVYVFISHIFCTHPSQTDNKRAGLMLNALSMVIKLELVNPPSKVLPSGILGQELSLTCKFPFWQQEEPAHSSVSSLNLPLALEGSSLLQKPVGIWTACLSPIDSLTFPFMLSSATST